MTEYLIIDLPTTRKVGTVMFWGVGKTVTTPSVNAAMVVNDNHLNSNLDRFDNGATTQAVLKSVAIEHKNNLEKLLRFKLKEHAA